MAGVTVVTASDTVPPGVLPVLATALLALVLTVVAGWLVDQIVVMAHEGSHALTAAFLGIPVHTIKVKLRTGGTEVIGLGALSNIPFTMAGYLGPSAFGLLGCIALRHGRTDVVLWGSLALLVLLLGFTDNWFGRFAVAVIAGGLFLAAYRKSPELHVWVACTWTWLLLMGGLRTAVAHRTSGLDHQELRRATLLPVTFWGGLSVLAAVTSLGLGALMLLGIVTVAG
jgi:hypothetical protein